MKWYNSLLFKFTLIVLAAIFFMPIAIPFSSTVIYLPTILLKNEETPYKGYNELESMWHAGAKKLAGKTDEEILQDAAKVSILLVNFSSMNRMVL